MTQTSLYEPLRRREVGLVDAALREVEAAGGMDLSDPVEKLAQRGLTRERPIWRCMSRWGRASRRRAPWAC
jgi:hypothetical protein